MNQKPNIKKPITSSSVNRDFNDNRKNINSPIKNKMVKNSPINKGR